MSLNFYFKMYLAIEQILVLIGMAMVINQLFSKHL